jgi:DNA polymerase III alpha subunit
VLGLELEVARPQLEGLNSAAGPLVVLAADLTGWTSLCKLSTAVHLAEAHVLTLEQLAQHTAGLICLTGGVRAVVSKLIAANQLQAAQVWLSDLRALFPDCLYAELQKHSPEDGAIVSALAGLARANSLPLVATHTVHYLTPEQAALQRLLTAIRLNRPLDDPGQQMQTLKEHFVEGAEKRSGVPPEIGARVWELMAAFAGYGFPKAHAASYAIVAWRAAWCKAHHPAEFMAAVLANWGGYYSQRVYLTEARRLGLKIRPPHVNFARQEFSVVYADGQPTLYMGLNQVKELTQRTQQRILRERPFHSLSDFLARVDPRTQEAENLARVGALEGFGPIPDLLRQLKATERLPGQFALFGPEPSSGEDWPLAEKVAAQEELLGTGVDAHPLELVADRIARAGALTTLGAAARIGGRVRVAGMRQTWRRAAAARGDFVYFMELEDLEGMLPAAILGEVYRRHRKAFATPGPYVLEGTVELDSAREEPVLRVERAWALE